MRNSIECITHADHSIAFNMFLHFVTLRPWPFDLILTRDGLSLWQVWWLYFQPYWFYRADKQIDRITHRRLWTPYSATVVCLSKYTAFINNPLRVLILFNLICFQFHCTVHFHEIGFIHPLGKIEIPAFRGGSKGSRGPRPQWKFCPCGPNEVHDKGYQLHLFIVST